MQAFREQIKKRWNRESKGMLKTFLFWFFSLLFLESAFAFLMFDSYQKESVMNVLCSAVILAAVLGLIGQAGGKRFNTAATSALLFVLGILFSLQCVFFRIFKVFFSFSHFGLTDQLGDFWSDALALIGQNLLLILIFMLPFLVYVIFHKKIRLPRNGWKNYLVYPLVIVLTLLVFHIHVNRTKDLVNGSYDLYHRVNNASLNVKKLGVLNAYGLDLKRLFFGFEEKAEPVDARITEETDDSVETEDIFQYDANVLKLDFTKGIGNSEIKALHEAVQNDSGTMQNKFTGIFKGYNLIYITAESFHQIGVSKELTPTLYKLTHSGFQFDRYYTPTVLSTIGGEFQSLTGLYPDSSILPVWRSGKNTFPLGLGTVFQQAGYQTFAYHNNSYVFQDRNQYLKSIGLSNFLARYNGMEKRMNCNQWPQSDDEMIKVTLPDYVNGSEPFLAYYMTVSGHFPYTFRENNMANRHREAVENLDLPEEAKAYVATQIELDHALERLLQELEKAGKLDQTVIVLLADHYPYELELDQINRLSSYERDAVAEVNRNSLIIWNNRLKDLHIEKPCMSCDVLPTVYNLFGISYDSRLFAGRDILSDSFGIAIMDNGSWITKDGVYYANTGEFCAEKEVPEEYVRKVSNLVTARRKMSRLIIKNDYYRYVLPK